MLTKKESEVIVYFIGSHLKEVFRQKADSLSFNKLELINSYEEKDLRILQKEECHLYKILASALNRKKEDE